MKHGGLVWLKVWLNLAPEVKKDSNILLLGNHYCIDVNLFTNNYLSSNYMIDWLQVFLQCEIVQEYYDDTIRVPI